MKLIKVVKLGLYALSAMVMAFSTSAFANKDIIYPNAGSVTVNGIYQGAVTNSFAVGVDGNATLNSPVNSGNQVAFMNSWGIQDRWNLFGQNTSYDQLVTFNVATTQKPAGALNVSVTPISNCLVHGPGTPVCNGSVSFVAPATPGNYQILVTPQAGGSNGLAIKTLTINFHVASPVVQKLNTELKVAKQCVLLHGGDTSLSAKLVELVSRNAISGADINFFIKPELDINGDPTVPSIGNAITENDGVATLTYNVNGLGVGDYNLYAEFDGNAIYNHSNDSDILGVSYLFAGFQQPINADGTSIFGGRVIPIKIKLVDANGTPVADAAPTVWLTSYDTVTGLGTDLEQVSSVSAADTGNTMRYDPVEQKYIYNWDATSLANGTYAVVVDLGDSAACSKGPYYAIITVAKKGKK